LQGSEELGLVLKVLRPGGRAVGGVRKVDERLVVELKTRMWANGERVVPSTGQL
jgi:hypothetical protein